MCGGLPACLLSPPRAGLAACGAEVVREGGGGRGARSAESNGASWLPWKRQQVQRAQWHCGVEKIVSYKTFRLDTVTTMSCAFSPVMSKCLRATLVTVCTGGDPLLLSP